MANYDFKKDLKLGQKCEKVIIKELEALGMTYVSDCNNNQYDVLMHSPKLGKDITFEIKTDIHNSIIGNDSGNIFVEFESRGKQSGVMVSKADYFIYYLLFFDEFWMIKTEDLKNIGLNNEHEWCANSGDSGSVTKGWLVNRNSFKNNFKIVKTMTKYTEI